MRTRPAHPPRTAACGRRRQRPLRTLRRLVTALLLLALVGGGALAAYAVLVIEPQIAPLAATAQSRVERLVAAHGGTYLARTRLGLWLPRATTAVEDWRFAQHGAIDLRATARALLFDLRGGRPLQGGATIDAQLAERLLPPASTDLLTQGLRVLLLATHLDRTYGKDGVLVLYLNDIYYGRGAYGAAAAARSFFGCAPEHLTASQAAFLAGLPNAPALYGDHPWLPATQDRWRLVLVAMARAHDLDTSQEQAFLRAGPPPVVEARYAVARVQEMRRKRKTLIVEVS